MKENNKQVHWYQVPVMWVAIAVLLLFIVACVHLVMVSRGLETPAPEQTGTVMRVPTE